MISGELEFVAIGCPELFRAKRSGFECVSSAILGR